MTCIDATQMQLTAEESRGISTARLGDVVPDHAMLRQWFARYVAGTGWGAPANIGSAAATFTANQPRIAVDVNGNALVVWERFGGTVQDIWVNEFK